MCTALRCLLRLVCLHDELVCAVYATDHVATMEALQEVDYG